MNIGDKYTFYDGGGHWGNWLIEILDVDSNEIRYRMTNKVSKQVVENTEPTDKVLEYLNKDEWSWEKIK